MSDNPYVDDAYAQARQQRAQDDAEYMNMRRLKRDPYLNKELPGQGKRFLDITVKDENGKEVPKAFMDWKIGGLRPPRILGYAIVVGAFVYFLVMSREVMNHPKDAVFPTHTLNLEMLFIGLGSALIASGIMQKVADFAPQDNPIRAFHLPANCFGAFITQVLTGSMLIFVAVTYIGTRSNLNESGTLSIAVPLMHLLGAIFAGRMGYAIATTGGKSSFDPKPKGNVYPGARYYPSSEFSNNMGA